MLKGSSFEALSNVFFSRVTIYLQVEIGQVAITSETLSEFVVHSSSFYMARFSNYGAAK